MQFLCEYNLLQSKHNRVDLDVMCAIPWTYFSGTCILLKEMTNKKTKYLSAVSGMSLCTCIMLISNDTSESITDCFQLQL